MFMSLVLSNIYKTVFFSKLTIPEYESAIDTIDDFLNAIKTDSHWILIKENTAITYAITNSQPDDLLFYPIKQHMFRFVFAMKSNFK